MRLIDSFERDNRSPWSVDRNQTRYGGIGSGWASTKSGERLARSAFGMS
jgi:hypothetical protein